MTSENSPLSNVSLFRSSSAADFGSTQPPEKHQLLTCSQALVVYGQELKRQVRPLSKSCDLKELSEEKSHNPRCKSFYMAKVILTNSSPEVSVRTLNPLRRPINSLPEARPHRVVSPLRYSSDSISKF